MDGIFYYAVTSPRACIAAPPAIRAQPNRENVVFFQAAVRRGARPGYRACKRCQPRRVSAARPACGDGIEEFAVHLKAIPGSDRPHCRHWARIRYEPVPYPADVQERDRDLAARLRRRLPSARAENGLKSGRSVTTAMYDAGYGSSSRLYERTGAQLGMTPATYRKQGRGAHPLLDRGFGLGNGAGCLHGEGRLRHTIRNRRTAETGVAARVSSGCDLSKSRAHGTAKLLLARLEGGPASKACRWIFRPLRFSAGCGSICRRSRAGRRNPIAKWPKRSASQKPPGRWPSACAANPVAVVIPCHRVIRGNGELGGYRWGLERKQALLSRRERGVSAKPIYPYFSMRMP